MQGPEDMMLLSSNGPSFTLGQPGGEQGLKYCHCVQIQGVKVCQHMLVIHLKLIDPKQMHYLPVLGTFKLELEP